MVSPETLTVTLTVLQPEEDPSNVASALPEAAQQDLKRARAAWERGDNLIAYGLYRTLANEHELGEAYCVMGHIYKKGLAGQKVNNVLAQQFYRKAEAKDESCF